jgi:hypothetical protein
VVHEGRQARARRAAGRAARGGRRLTGFLERSLGVTGSAPPQEIKARYRSLAQRCAGGEADADEAARLRTASVALAQELNYLGHDAGAIEALLVGEGCPRAVAAEVAASTAGPITRRVADPLERQTVRPEDEAYTRLAARLESAETMRKATASSYGFGFIARLAIAFVIVMVALTSALDFVPRAFRAPRSAAPPAPVPIELLPAPAKGDAKR